MWAQLVYLVAAVCFILALKGLSSPRTARRGNLIGAAGAALATVLVFAATSITWCRSGSPSPSASAVGAVGAYRVQMTQMPQLVALFNGVGGGAAAIVALVELDEISGPRAPSGGATVHADRHRADHVIGSVSFTGSIVTFLKLQELMTTRPITFAGYPDPVRPRSGRAIGFGLFLALFPTMVAGIALAVIGAGVGVLLVLPVGGADVPIVISLLNAFTGLSVAASGYVLENPLLLVAGTLVGAAGTLLTKLMATAMGRSLGSTLFGALKGGSTLGGGEASDRPVKAIGPADVAILLAYAERVIIVPGYGLAVAQAQHTLQAAGRRADRARCAGRLRDPPGRRPDARAHERAAGRGPGAVRAAAGDGRDRPGVPHHRRRPGGGRQRRGQPGRRDQPGRADLRDADPARHPGPAGDLPEALDAAGLRRASRTICCYEPQTSLLFGDAKDTLAKVLAEVKALRV